MTNKTLYVLCMSVVNRCSVRHRGIKHLTIIILTSMITKGGKTCIKPVLEMSEMLWNTKHTAHNKHGLFCKLQIVGEKTEIAVTPAVLWSPALILFHKRQTVPQLLSCTSETFHSDRTSFYLRLCSPSFAPCLPYKYSPRIKRAPLASWPLMKLRRSISYHSSCVACQTGRVPDETLRAHIREVGGSLGCSHAHCYAHHLPVLTISRKFKPWHSWIHKGVLKSGPTFACQKCVWVIEVEIWPSWALKRSKSMDSSILKGKTAQFEFSHTFSWCF